MPLDVFRELEIHGESEQIRRLMDYIGAHPAGDWRREPEIEAKIARQALTDQAPFVFSYNPDPATDLTAGLWLFFDEPNKLRVSNIVPWGERNELTREQYNVIAANFYNTMVLPTAERFGVAARLSEPVAQIEEYLSERVAQALRRFSATANRATGTGHPNDHQRWMDFVILAHLDNVALDATTLARWFHESEGWPGEQASNLASQYEDARILLHTYDAHPAR